LVKREIHSRTGREVPEWMEKYSSTLSLTPATFFPGKRPVPIVQETGSSPGPFWMGAGNFAPPGFDPQTVQPVASRYTSACGWLVSHLYILAICKSLPRHFSVSVTCRNSRNVSNVTC